MLQPYAFLNADFFFLLNLMLVPSGRNVCTDDWDPSAKGLDLYGFAHST